MRALRLSVLPAGIALGVAAEWTVLHRPSFAAAATAREQRLAAADFVVGIALLLAGELCRRRRPQSRVGQLFALAGFAWFLGSFAGASFDSVARAGSVLVALHRGPLVHAVLSYPSGRLRGRGERLLAAAAYVSSAVSDVGQSAEARIALAALIVLVATRAYARSAGAGRQARRPALAAAAVLGGALAAGGAASLVDAGAGADRAVLWAYEAVIVAIALVFTLDLVGGRWAEATLANVVVDLGDVPEERALRERLARALGDPSLAVGYWAAEEDAFLDEAGERLELPEGEPDRGVTVVRDGERPIAALVHDPAALDDLRLRDSVAAAVRLAVSNVRLQAEIRRQAEQLAASRRRIVEAADLERRRLERELRRRTEAPLERLEELLAHAQADGADPEILAQTLAELATARAELRELGAGIHPRLLTEQGLAAALADLLRRAPLPVALRAPGERLPSALEAAAYFVCSEALANVGKHARASRAAIEIDRADGRLRVVVRDDGAGGADLGAGSGLRGLADRVEALGGRFEVESPPGGGTAVVAELPL